jgi:hypothetical protein
MGGQVVDVVDYINEYNEPRCCSLFVPRTIRRFSRPSPTHARRANKTRSSTGQIVPPNRTSINPDGRWAHRSHSATRRSSSDLLPNIASQSKHRSIDPSNPSIPNFSEMPRAKKKTRPLSVAFRFVNVACEEAALRNLLPDNHSFRMAEGYEHTGHQFR